MSNLSKQLCNCLDNECHAAPGWTCRKKALTSNEQAPETELQRVYKLSDYWHGQAIYWESEAHKFQAENRENFARAAAAVWLIPEDKLCGELQALLRKVRGMLSADSHSAPETTPSGWRPIETAPKDGSPFLGWWSHENKVLHTHWLDNTKTAWPWAGWRAPSLQVSHPNAKPTHWMPLPAPPGSVEETSPHPPGSLEDLIGQSCEECAFIGGTHKPTCSKSTAKASAPRGKPCTCDNCLGSSTSCRVDAGERLGDLWYCRKRAENGLANVTISNKGEKS